MSTSVSHPVAVSNFGSPHGVTVQSQQMLHLWHITYYIGIPLAAIVVGLISWCVWRYRRKSAEAVPPQFQYHIPLEVTYTIIPLAIVAIIFGFMAVAEQKIDRVTKNPAVEVKVEGFQWGWRFTYPNGHQEVGTVATSLDINSTANLPILRLPSHQTVQLDLVTDDVNHSFYVPEFLFKRDMIAGINNRVDFNITSNGTFFGECTQLCGVYHAYMRFLVQVMPVGQYQSWYAQQAPNSITTAGSST